MRRTFLFTTLATMALVGSLSMFWPAWLWSSVLLLPLFGVGFYDYFQKRSSVLRNFPLVGHLRFILEAIRPEISQYFIETETGGRPFSREERSVVYQRAKNVRDTVPFGTIRDVYEVGYEWVNHSIVPEHVDPQALRKSVGGPDCKQPYESSLLNISAMSFGSLSSNAIVALNRGARLGGFAHNTGEGGLSKYHLKGGGDITWQIGTGYFGCRTRDGRFDHGAFRERSLLPQVKMIELKLSQGAKPGHGGILPKAKLTPEIAEIRLVPMGQDVLSPPAHSAFSTPIEMCEFLGQLREGSGGKPVGFKLCVGKWREFMALCKAMGATGIIPDFITVDGGEGGTGAAPLEFTNSVGAPLLESLVFVHTTLVGFDLRDRIRVVASGKVVTAFDLLKRLALGADICNAARSMMLALGCIQARRCNSNKCPVGVATQDPSLVEGLDVEDKAARVAAYHEQTLDALSEIVGAMGLSHSRELKPWHIMRRTSPHEIKNYSEIFSGYAIRKGELLNASTCEHYGDALSSSSALTFRRAPEEAPSPHSLVSA